MVEKIFLQRLRVVGELFLVLQKKLRLEVDFGNSGRCSKVEDNDRI